MTRKMMLLFVCIFLIGSVLAACSNNDNGNGNGNDVTNESSATNSNEDAANDSENSVEEQDLAEKLDISFMIRSYGEGLVEDSPVWAHLEEKFNIEMDITWVPSGEYNETLSVRAAANNLPDVYNVPSKNVFQDWVELGAFVDMKPYLDSGEYPNLIEYIDQASWEVLNPTGKYYGAPYFSYVTRDVLGIRTDWLENLDLEMPTTTEEFFDVAYAFAHDDPDQNGQNDTVGYSTAGIFNSYLNGYIMGAFGLANEWKEEDGELIPMESQTEELTEYITYYKKMYDEGVLDRDFPILKTPQLLERALSGTTGFMSLNPNNYTTLIVNPLQEAFSDAQIAAIHPPTGPTGLSSTVTGGTPSVKQVINAKTTDEVKQRRIMMLLDYMMSEEGYDVISHGIEGIHWKKTDDGGFEKLEAWDTDQVHTLVSWFFRRFDPNIQIKKWETQERIDTVKGMFDIAAEHVWPLGGLGLTSQTKIEKEADLKIQLEQELMKIIVGDEPIEHVEEATAQWRDNGGDVIIKEMNEAFQASK